MSDAAMGAKVMYCGHNGWFTADIYVVAGACVVRGNGPINGGMLRRDDVDQATHHLVDFPDGGFWRPDIGVFVVPAAQVIKLPTRPVAPKSKAPKAKKR